MREDIENLGGVSAESWRAEDTLKSDTARWLNSALKPPE